MPTNWHIRGPRMFALMQERYNLEQIRESNDRPSLTLDAEILRNEQRTGQLVIDECIDRYIPEDMGRSVRQLTRQLTGGDARQIAGDARQRARGDERERIRDDAQGNAEARDSGQDSGNDPCPICLERKQDPLETPCHHVFCSDCITRWLDEAWNDTCPSCRADLDIRDLRPVTRRQQTSSNQTSSNQASVRSTEDQPAHRPATRDRRQEPRQSERHRRPTANSTPTTTDDSSSPLDGAHRSSSSNHGHRRERSPESHQAGTSRGDHQQNRSAGHWLPLLPPRSPQDHRRTSSSRHRQRSSSPQGPPEYHVVYEEYVEYSEHPQALPPRRQESRANETSREAKMREKIEQMRILLNRSEEVAVCIDALKRRQGNVFAAVDYLRGRGSLRMTREPRSVELGEAITRELRRYPVLWEHLVDL